VQYEHITTTAQLSEFCQKHADATVIGFDTEFVSEDTYRPDLCLVQVAVGKELAVIDPHACGDVTEFWEWLAADGHETIVHAGREELRFALHATGKAPANLFDIQIAAGMTGMEYPAAYSKLISKLLHKQLPKGETRTDWRKRPLSARQIEYALQDVLYLEPIRDLLANKIEKAGRRSWLEDELNAWQTKIEQSELNKRWRRVSGIASLGPRNLAVVRELWLWRDAIAERRNQPPRRVLRDDLLIELARQQTPDPRRISAIRGMERGDLKRKLPEITACIERALELQEEELPQRVRKRNSPHLNLLAQFLTTALGSVCRAQGIAPSLVGATQDVRDLIEVLLHPDDADASNPPALARGWRAEIVGRQIEDLLMGRLAICIDDPVSDRPLKFVQNPAAN